MPDQETIDLYEAIRQMRKLTSEGKFFSFVHSTYNRDTQTTNGIRAVNKAHLRPQAKGDDVLNSDFKLFYIDDVLDKPRTCWQMLILFFNDKKVILN